jgi:hypothetical protein
MNGPSKYCIVWINLIINKKYGNIRKSLQMLEVKLFIIAGFGADDLQDKSNTTGV